MDRGAFQTRQNTSFVTKNKKCSRSTELLFWSQKRRCHRDSFTRVIRGLKSVVKLFITQLKMYQHKADDTISINILSADKVSVQHQSV